jgi:co-chaperonin GroES (HSP10)
MLIASGYRIILEMEEVTERTKGGIILPSEVVDKDAAAKEWGKVISMGNCAYHDMPSPWCGLGDIVGIVRYNGTVMVDPETDKKYRLINDKDVLCIRHENK